jgi:hypothetical protein
MRLLPEAQTEERFRLMKRLLLATALALATGLVVVRITPDDERSSERSLDLPSAAEAQRCMSRFEALDRSPDGILAANELDDLRTAVKDVDKNKDGKIHSVEYQAACATGVLNDSDIKS